MKRIALDRNRERGVGAGCPRRRPGSQRCGVGACAQARGSRIRAPVPDPGARRAARAAWRADTPGAWPEVCAGQGGKKGANMEAAARAFAAGHSGRPMAAGLLRP